MVVAIYHANFNYFVSVVLKGNYDIFLSLTYRPQICSHHTS